MKNCDLHASEITAHDHHCVQCAALYFARIYRAQKSYGIKVPPYEKWIKIQIAKIMRYPRKNPKLILKAQTHVAGLCALAQEAAHD